MQRPYGRNVRGVLEEQQGGLYSWSRVSSLCLAGLVRSPQGPSQNFQRERYQELTFSLLPIQLVHLARGFSVWAPPALVSGPFSMVGLSWELCGC